MSYIFQYKAYEEEYTLSFQFGQYENSQLAVMLNDKKEGPFGKLTVAVTDVPSLGENEILVKDWAENELLVLRMLELGLIAYTGNEVQTGFVIAKVATMRKELAEEAREYWKARV